MLDGVNDTPEHARKLDATGAGGATRRAVPCKFNLIPFNPFPASGLKRSPRERVLAFAQVPAGRRHRHHRAQDAR